MPHTPFLTALLQELKVGPQQQTPQDEEMRRDVS